MPAFDSQSRYRNVENASLTVTEADGTTRQITYKRRRFLPRLDAFSQVAQHPLREGERLDLIAREYLDDSERYWQICDANPILHPGELTESLGDIVNIAAPDYSPLGLADAYAQSGDEAAGSGDSGVGSGDGG